MIGPTSKKNGAQVAPFFLLLYVFVSGKRFAEPSARFAPGLPVSSHLSRLSLFLYLNSHHQTTPAPVVVVVPPRHPVRPTPQPTPAPEPKKFTQCNVFRCYDSQGNVYPR
ncbi:hypothetical protein [Acidovorax sp. GW101-3H11]|uniref:hypothetical protein n=1 Tax=Acidovorax sp. GW101-3H11 TaxID=1813946 RepID=UPI0032219EA9